MKNITPLDAVNILKEDKGAILIDVRTDDEVAEVSVPGAKHIPLDELPSRLDEIENFSSLLFLCRSGGRSVSAAMIAESAKLPGVMNVMGGIIGWAGAGLPIVRGGSRGFISQKALVAIGVILGGIALALFIFMGSNSHAGTAQASSFRHLPAPQFEEAIQKPGVVILDVRTKEEYATGHIAGAININFYDPNFQEELSKLDKGVTYDVYCHSGSRSGKTLLLMQGLGFSNVEDLSGGITSWVAGGRPVDR